MNRRGSSADGESGGGRNAATLWICSAPTLKRNVKRGETKPLFDEMRGVKNEALVS